MRATIAVPTRRALSSFLAFALATAGCVEGLAEHGDPGVAAIVNGAVISREAVAARASTGVSPQRALDALVDDELAVQAARAAHLVVSAAEVESVVGEIKRENRFTDDAALAHALVTQGYTIERYRLDLERQLLRFRAINAFVASSVVTTDPASRRAELDAKTHTWMDGLRARAKITINATD
jgi:SurA N-terminal domain